MMKYKLNVILKWILRKESNLHFEVDIERKEGINRIGSINFDNLWTLY